MHDGIDDYCGGCARDEAECICEPNCSSTGACSKAEKFNAAKAAYIKLTNDQESIDPDTGKFYYSADSEIMDALHDFFIGSL